MSRAIPKSRTALIPVVDWRAAVVQAPSMSRAGRFIARRYRLQPHLAQIVADLAGFADQGERQ